MAAGTNSVAVFFEDGSYRHEAWDKIAELLDEKLHVSVHVMHHQSSDPAALPNRIIFDGRDINGLFYREGDGSLVVRSIILAGQAGNDTVRQSRFYTTGQQQIEVGMEYGVERAIAGFIVHEELSFNDSSYDDLIDDALAADLRSGAVPASGTYST